MEITADVLRDIAAVQLKARTKHMYLVPRAKNEFFSWIELGVYDSLYGIHPKFHPEDESEMAGVELAWVSHRHQVDDDLEWQNYEGTFFGPDHEVWREVKEGDYLGVRICAQSIGVENIEAFTDMLVWNFWRPSIVL